MTKKTSKSSDKLRAVSDPPIAMSSEEKMVVDPAEMLRIWSMQSQVLREVADGQEEAAEEMRKTREDNIATRNTSRKTRRVVLTSCVVTVLCSVSAAYWVTSVITKADKDVRAMVSEQTVEAQKTRAVGEELKKKSDLLAQLQTAVLEADIAQKESEVATPTESVAAQQKVKEKIATASVAAKKAKRVLGPVEVHKEDEDED